MNKTRQQQQVCIKAIKAAQYLFENELAKANSFVTQNELDCALHLASSLSTYAYLNFTGYYTSYQLEKVVQQIGSKAILPIKIRSTPKSDKRRILHVASELYELGGHTPLLLKWIQRDQDSSHQLFLTRQSAKNIPSIIFQAHNITADSILWSNNGESLVETAQQLLAVAGDFDFLVLHIHPNDVVPLLAFANQKPVPIYFMNHADHCFWLGASIIDGLIQLRETTLLLDQQNRSVGSMAQFILPIPIAVIATEFAEKKELLSPYGITNPDSIILLTTSTESKFNPLFDYNYFESIIPVLDKNPHAFLFIVGIGADKELAKKYQHNQIKFLGYLLPSDLAKIENISDIYIETFPFSSFTALLQVLMKQNPVHFMFAPPNIFRLFSDSNLYSATKEEWQQKLSELISDKKELIRYSTHLYNAAAKTYSTEAWQSALLSFYKKADANNNPSPLYYQQDKSFYESVNEWFLYGISLKSPYEFHFFETKSKQIQLGRILEWLKIYILKFSHRSQLFSFGTKAVLTKILKLIKVII
jgi:hypothetical protein